MDKVISIPIKTYSIAAVMLILLAAVLSFFATNTQVQAAPDIAISIDSGIIRSGYCSAIRSLVHRAMRQRMDFSLSDGRGNALGLRDGINLSDSAKRAIFFKRMDYSLSNGNGNALGLRNENISLGSIINETQLMRLDFALSNGSGNALGLRNGGAIFANSASTAICQ